MKPLASLTDTELLRVAHDAAALDDAPEPVIQAAIALWPRPASGNVATRAAALASGVIGEGLRRLRAVLEVDSAHVPAFASGLRSSSSSTRQLVFSVDGCDVDLRIVASSEGHAVSGQVLGPEEGGRVELRRAGELAAESPLAHSELDPLGEFRLDPVRATACVITLHLPTMIIELPEIDLGPPGR